MSKRFGGKILVHTRKDVEGSFKQNSWDDSWQVSYDIQFDGEITPEIASSILEIARNNRKKLKLQERESSWGALRWSNADVISHVDCVNKKLIVNCSCNLCD